MQSAYGKEVVRDDAGPMDKLTTLSHLNLFLQTNKHLFVLFKHLNTSDTFPFLVLLLLLLQTAAAADCCCCCRLLLLAAAAAAAYYCCC